MQFFLTGGGDFDCFKTLDREFDKMLRGNDRLQILPYASDPGDYDDIYDRVCSTYGNKNKIAFEMEKDIFKLKEHMLVDSRALFIEGGNTFDLITAVRKANIETYFKSFSNEDEKLIYADSAGAIILGKSVRTAFFGDDADEDERRLQDYRGLDLLGSWAVHAHYTPDDDDTVMNFVYDEGIPILALYEETGIFLSENQEVVVHSNAPVAIFTAAGKQMIEANQKATLTDFY